MASTSTSNPPSKFDVFLSFRGDDTRKNFTDHLYKALERNGIYTFRDDKELEKGGVMTPELLKAIEESRLYIIIFSKNYASSRWCLDELVKIAECRIEMKQRVLPVFYHVYPSDVRNQTGSYEEAFIKHGNDANQEKSEKIQRWRTALTEVGKIIGWPVDDQYESEVIEQIIVVVLKKLNRKIFDGDENLVGMNSMLEELNSLINFQLNDVLMVGIYGLGGIGKTTLAKAFCDKISGQFGSYSFLHNVRERSKDTCGMLQLQQQLLNDVGVNTKRGELSYIGEGIDVIKQRVRLKKVLIILDDVDNLNQLDCLAGSCDWFGLGSIIIITTRDKHLLDVHGVRALYKAKELKYEDAIQLFSCNAFKQYCPTKSYESLSNRAVNLAKGLPLALKVFGCHLSCKTILEWESALDKLERKPNKEVQDVLRISFDGLDDKEKDVFLDIACFFQGQSEDFATRILDGCDFHAKDEMRVLSDKCLITLCGDIIEMHDLLQEMGREIVREASPKEPGKWSRLWDLEDIYRVLTRNTGTEAIEGIFLDMSKSKSKKIKFTTKAFKMMKRLRLLKVHRDDLYGKYHCMDSPSKKNFTRDFEFPSYELRYLHWDGYPFESLPSNFHGEDLVELNFRRSKIKHLLQKNKRLEKLKVIDLTKSIYLIEIPNFSNFPNLEILILEGCENLQNLPSGICKLKNLRTLVCTFCTKLKSFPEIEEDMKNLRELCLVDTSIQDLPSSVERLKGLEFLRLQLCRSLVNLPDSICNLTSLKSFDLQLNSKLKKLPERLGSLQCLEDLSALELSCQWPSLSGLSSLKYLDLRKSDLRQAAILSDISCLCSLEELDLYQCNLVEGQIPSEICQLSMLKVLNLSGNHFRSLPAGIGQLSKLRVLGLSHCKLLEEIPELPSSLKDINAHDCACLETLSSPLSLPWKRQLWCSLFNCFKSEVQDLDYVNRSASEKFVYFAFFGMGISIVIPGSSGIPEWIRSQNMGSEVTIELPMNWHEDKNLLGFVLCSLYAPVEDELENESENDSEDESENESEEKSQREEDDGLDAEEPTPFCIECELSIMNGDQFEFVDSLSFFSDCDCYLNGASDQVWLLYYPKIAIPAGYCSNQWRNFVVTFDCYLRGKRVMLEKCGYNLIYGQEEEWAAAADTNVNIKRSLEDTENNNPAEDPHNKSLGGPDPDYKTKNSPQLNQESSF